MTVRAGSDDPPAPKRWSKWAGGLVSAALVGAILLQLRHTPGAAAASLARLPPAAWLLSGLIYLVQPLGDFAIFRRLWKLPPVGFAALLRKNAINETVVGYGGEVYLRLWAQGRPGIPASWATLKDVNILSAAASSLITLALLAWTVTQLGGESFVRQLGPAFWPGLALTAAPLVLLAFGRRVFALAPGDLAFVGGAHLLRALAVSGLTVLLWKLARTEAPLSLCLSLLALRLFVSRLPFLPNKELLFGVLALFFAGAQAPLAQLLATLALANLLTHLAVVVLLPGGRLARRPAVSVATAAQDPAGA